MARSKFFFHLSWWLRRCHSRILISSETLEVSFFLSSDWRHGNQIIPPCFQLCRLNTLGILQVFNNQEK